MSPLHPRLAGLAALILIVSACGPGTTPVSPGGSVSPNGGSLKPGAASASPGGADTRTDEASLPAPVSEESGDLPAPVEPPSPLNLSLTVGTAVPIAAATIGATGGSLHDPSDANGFRLDLPAGAVGQDAHFAVSAAPISGLAAEAASWLTPITPLYAVDDGGATFALPVSVTLPLGTAGAKAVPASSPDQVAMVFTYDAASGRIAPLSPISADATSLPAAAAHFSDFFGALVDAAGVPATVDSGFRPGIDDWQFPNYGSYVAPGGHCEGQSVSAIWYYLAQRRAAGAAPLYGLYDNNGAAEKTPTFWYDDSDGYRLASVVQADPVAVSFTYKFLQSMRDNTDGRLVYAALRAAIYASGEPQLIQMTTADHQSVHTMIAYRVTPTRVYVADPNYPAHLRTITYDAASGVLGPYSSGDNAGSIAAAGQTSYTKFAFLPPRASSSDAALAAHWAEFSDSTVGHTQFPDYRLEVVSGQDADGNDIWVPLTDGYTAPEPTITVRLTDPAGIDATRVGAYRGISSSPLVKAAAKITIPLEPGPNALGLREIGSKPEWTSYKYVNFVRLTVNAGPAESPSPATGAGWVLSGGKADTVYPNDTASSAIGNAFTPADGQIGLDSWGPKAENGNIVEGSRVDTNASLTWNSPPARAAPGDTWNVNLSLDPGCPLAMPLQAHLSAPADYSTGLSGAEIVSLEQSPCKGAASAAGSFVFPSRGDTRWPKDTLTIEAEVELQGIDGGSYTYTYTWQGQ